MTLIDLLMFTTLISRITLFENKEMVIYMRILHLKVHCFTIYTIYIIS